MAAAYINSNLLLLYCIIGTRNILMVIINTDITHRLMVVRCEGELFTPVFYYLFN